MLDPGSTVTLITGGTTTSEIGVGSMFDLEDNEIRIVAQVIDTITADCPVQDLGDIQTMPFLDAVPTLPEAATSRLPATRQPTKINDPALLGDGASSRGASALHV